MMYKEALPTTARLGALAKEVGDFRVVDETGSSFTVALGAQQAHGNPPTGSLGGGSAMAAWVVSTFAHTPHL